MKFRLPPIVTEIEEVRCRLREHFSSSQLKFGFDGNFVGDLGEALAQKMFDIKLSGRNTAGIDGKAPGDRTVQIKATTEGRGPVFRPSETRAQNLIFFSFNFADALGEVIYNGPEELAISSLAKLKNWKTQRMIPIKKIIILNNQVEPEDRISFVNNSVEVISQQEVIM